ncbi:hypothetical protein [Legionella septentrionalis]|uniref:Uncharacterized protein n=1 Tax=Legionella septentrionalis TaxID=2498109 RepID=A0A3S0V4V2_9GAMM|nr:hypothetical protein [Legionella septentrionalis]RUQ84478.1 hypothetical protein EKM59_08495 [Legionella septentrionalis]
MGRWLKKIENITASELTKPTKIGCVSFVSSTYSSLPKNSRDIILKSFVDDCCIGLSVETAEVINGLISNEDEEDILKGLIPNSCLRLHIQLWMVKGQPSYAGKS